jgi:hypothetical protein
MGRPISPGPPRLSTGQIAQLVTADKSHFDRRDVIQAVANCLPAGAPGYQVEELADAYPALERVEAMAARSDCATVPKIVVSRVLAGMVDSRSFARLIARAQEADAKLVLIGDPEQLGEIEAGGLFGAVADRVEPIVLNEVIR